MRHTCFSQDQKERSEGCEACRGLEVARGRHVREFLLSWPLLECMVYMVCCDEEFSVYIYILYVLHTYI